MQLNVIFLGDFPYPQGMAGTKRVQHAINALKENRIGCSVIVTRQSTGLNQPEGVYQGTKYSTIMPDLIGWRLGLFLPMFISKSFSVIRRAFESGKKNILYVYGPPFLSNIFTVIYARSVGYFIVFDIVEDEDYAKGIAKGMRHKVKVYFNRYLTNRIEKFADGILVISSALEAKFRKLTNGRLALHLRPISIDPNRSKLNSSLFNSHPTMFYSGSFGVKDGINELIDAFDRLAVKYSRLKLVMTGEGTERRMKEVFNRIECSPVKNRIEHKGYVDDDSYYELLAECDIPCMTRINNPYSNAGFPFKLGEYLVTGKPVIASRVSDVGKFLTDRFDAVLVKPGDSTDIADAVAYLLTNPEKATEIGKRGREKALKSFDYRLQGKGLVKFLHAL
jgi:glycosyltransferase involved in cell wall biosynthesis